MTSLKSLLLHVILVKGIPLMVTSGHVITLEDHKALKYTIIDLAVMLLSPSGRCIAQVRDH